MLNESFSESYKAAPRWQQVLIFVLLLAGAGVGIDRGVDLIYGSPQARAIKNQLKPLAGLLEQAQQVGDQQAALALMEPTTKLIEDYNNLDETSQEAVNSSALRYCFLATIHLSDGVSEVLSSGYWSKKDQYKNALDRCK